ncbi:MAG: hypothetical protein IT320_17240 [Anaerolineae bacterium]|nr:hypothetical protein [Anaerolineae bacterium]
MDEYTATLNETAAEISRAIPCRVCGEKHLRAYVQMGVAPKPAYILVECRNPACKLHMATRSFDDWCTMDLTQWGAVERPGWTADITALAAAHNDAHARPATLCDLVESFIKQQEGALWEVVLRDFRDQLRDAVPHTRRAFAERWLRLYTRRGA